MLLGLARNYQSFVKCIATAQAGDISGSSMNDNKTQNIIPSHDVDAVGGWCQRWVQLEGASFVQS